MSATSAEVGARIKKRVALKKEGDEVALMSSPTALQAQAQAQQRRDATRTTYALHSMRPPWVETHARELGERVSRTTITRYIDHGPVGKAAIIDATVADLASEIVSNDTQAQEALRASAPQHGIDAVAILHEAVSRCGFNLYRLHVEDWLSDKHQPPSPEVLYLICRTVRALIANRTGAAAMNVAADGGQEEEEVELESDLETIFDSDSDEESEQ